MQTRHATEPGAPVKASRRRFIGRAIVAGGAAGVVAAGATSAGAAELSKDVANTAQPGAAKSAGYRETAHVSRYYQLARD